MQPRGGHQIGICNGVQNSRCPGNIRKIYIGCPHPHKPELGDGTHGAGPFRAVLYWSGHLTYLQPLTGFIDMLNSCGPALSQGDGSDFHPRSNWDAMPPGYSACVRAWRRLAPCHGATPAWTYYGSPGKLEGYRNAGRYNCCLLYTSDAADDHGIV